MTARRDGWVGDVDQRWLDYLADAGVLAEAEGLIDGTIPLGPTVSAEEALAWLDAVIAAKRAEEAEPHACDWPLDRPESRETPPVGLSVAPDRSGGLPDPAPNERTTP